jgi:hypothetical protein
MPADRRRLALRSKERRHGCQTTVKLRKQHVGHRHERAGLRHHDECIPEPFSSQTHGGRLTFQLLAEAGHAGDLAGVVAPTVSPGSIHPYSVSGSVTRAPRRTTWHARAVASSSTARRSSTTHPPARNHRPSAPEACGFTRAHHVSPRIGDHHGGKPIAEVVDHPVDPAPPVDAEHEHPPTSAWPRPDPDP